MKSSDAGKREPEKPRSEPEIIPPGQDIPHHATPGDFRRDAPEGVFIDFRQFEFRKGEGAFAAANRIGGLKLVVFLIAAIALAFSLAAIFASVFVIVLAVTACLAALGFAIAWLRKLFRSQG